jgi:hypothetical protein
MSTTAHHGPRVTLQSSGSRMRAFVQIVGGILLGLGLGLAAAVGLDPGLLSASYALGLGLLLLCLGLLLPEDPDAAAGQRDRSCSPRS